MTMKMIREQIRTLCPKVSFWEYEKEQRLSVTVKDFEGFDDDWSEIIVYVDDEPLIEWLEAHCDRWEGDFYYSYYFGDIEVSLGWASYDI